MAEMDVLVCLHATLFFRTDGFMFEHQKNDVRAFLGYIAIFMEKHIGRPLRRDLVFESCRLTKIYELRDMGFLRWFNVYFLASLGFENYE